MFKHVHLGRYVPGDSFAHRLDPRCKIFVCVAVIVSAFLRGSLAYLASWAGAVVVMTAFCGIRASALLAQVRSIRWLLVIMIAVNLIWTDGTPIFSISRLIVTREGAVRAAVMGMRMCILVCTAGLMMMVTSPKSFADGLEGIMSPLRYVGVPVGDIAMMMSLSLRFIPLLFDETEGVIRAQTARGADMTSGGAIRRVIRFVPILVPMFVLVFRRAEILADAMESRCYRAGSPRTRYKELAWTMRESAASVVIAAAAAVLYVLDLYISGRLI